MGKQLQPPETAKPLLTIAIPTHNRAWCLRELLPVLANELKDEPRVELIISDNASPDDTPSVCKTLWLVGFALTTSAMLKTSGPTQTFCSALSSARGKYVWIFSDDDLIVPGGLAKILAYCEAAEYDLVWVSSYSFGKFHKPLAVKARRDAIEISDPVAYVKRIHVFFTFITGNIINKDTVLKAGAQAIFRFGWNRSNAAGVDLCSFEPIQWGLYIREKLIAMRENNTGGYRLFQVFGPTLATITRNWLRSANLGRIVMNGTVQSSGLRCCSSTRRTQVPSLTKPSPSRVDSAFQGQYQVLDLRLPCNHAAHFTCCVVGFRRTDCQWLDKAAGFPMLYWGVTNDGADRPHENL